MRLAQFFLLLFVLSAFSEASLNDVTAWKYEKCEFLTHNGANYILGDPETIVGKIKSEFKVLLNLSALGSEDGRTVVFTADSLHRIYWFYQEKFKERKKDEYVMWKHSDLKVDGPWGRENGFKSERNSVTAIYEEWNQGKRQAMTTILAGVNSDKTQHYTIEKYDNQGNHVDIIVWEEKEGRLFRVFRGCGNNFGYKVLPGKLRQVAKKGDFSLELP